MEKNIHLAESCPPPAEESQREPPDIAKLTRRMAEGDEMAWHIFYEAYFGRLLRYLLVVAGSSEEAAREALQLTLIRVARHVKVFATEAAFWSWLTVLARSAFTDETRKRRRYFAFMQKFARRASDERVPWNEGEMNERLRALLEQGLTALPPEDRQLLDQKYLAHRAVREIADELQTTEKAVESKLSRVRKKLKDTMLAELKNEEWR